MLNQKIQDDLIAGLKAKNAGLVEMLRLLRSEIQNAQIEKKSELTDDEIISVLKKYSKKLKDATEMFEKGGRMDLVEHNRAQEEIISAYLPAEMSDEDLARAIDELIAQNADLYASNKNALIGIAMKQLSSQADSGRIMHILQSK